MRVRLVIRRLRVRPPPSRQHSFVEVCLGRVAVCDCGTPWTFLLPCFDHEIFSVVILSLPLFREGQLSSSGERMCTRTMLVNRLED